MIPISTLLGTCAVGALMWAIVIELIVKVVH